MHSDQIAFGPDGEIVISGRTWRGPVSYTLFCRIERMQAKGRGSGSGKQQQQWVHCSIGSMLPAGEHRSREAAESFIREHLERYGAGSIVHRDFCLNRPLSAPDPHADDWFKTAAMPARSAPESAAEAVDSDEQESLFEKW